MMNLLAGAFISFASLIGGLFGTHASTTPHGPFASSTPDREHVGSTSPDHGPMGSGIFGTVESIDGTTLTVVGHAGMKSATTTFTVDASNAKVIKQKVGTSTVASIAQGDHILVNGSVSGTSVTAKLIVDGIVPPAFRGKGSSIRMRPMPQMEGSSTRDGWNPGGPMRPESNDNRS